MLALVKNLPNLPNEFAMHMDGDVTHFNWSMLIACRILYMLLWDILDALIYAQPIILVNDECFQL